MKKEDDNWNRIIVWATTLILFGLWFVALNIGSHYKWDFFFLLLILWGLYFVRDRIKLHPFHFLLMALFLLLHDMGMFGLYKNFYFGLEFDLYVHGFFGLVASLILYRTYSNVGPYKGWFMIVAILALLLGFSAFHELFEYGGALVLGEGEGVLFVGAGDIDEWDTQKDMFNNLIGGLIGLSFYGLWNYFKNGRKKKNSNGKFEKRK